MPRALCCFIPISTHLEESPQPPNLEDGLANNDANNEQIPPLDASVGALRRIPVCPLADDDVGLLVLDLGEQLRQPAHLDLEGILRRFRLGHVYYTVDVEGDLLAVCTPVFVAEAEDVFPVVFGVEREVAGRDGLFIDLVLAHGVGDLVKREQDGTSQRSKMSGRQVAGRAGRRMPDLVIKSSPTALTQKSTSRLPALPNSRSPTWNVTVIVSSRCKFSW